MQTQAFANPHIPPVPRRRARTTAADRWITEVSLVGLIGLALSWGAAELALLLGG